MAVQVLGTDLEAIARRLPTEKQARLVASRAVNRAMVAGKTEAARRLSAEYTVLRRQVNEKVTTSKASSNRIEAAVTWRGGSLNLADFRVSPGKPQPSKRPILRATVARGAGAQEYKGAFLIHTRRGVQAFRRVANNDGRYPVTGVWGPSIPQLLGGQNIRDAVEVRARAVLNDRIEHEINRELLKGAR
jgi:hypothetical protein